MAARSVRFDSARNPVGTVSLSRWRRMHRTRIENVRLTAGIDGYLSKPLPPRMLAEVPARRVSQTASRAVLAGDVPLTSVIDGKTT